MAIAATTGWAIIEQRTRRAGYDMPQTMAILEHPAHGRIYITQGFGGMYALEGGKYRWRHGGAARVLPTDTLYSLDGYVDIGVSVADDAIAGFDSARPALGWDGNVLDRVARAAGL